MCLELGFGVGLSSDGTAAMPQKHSGFRYPVRNLCQNVNQHTPSFVKKFLLQKSAEQNGKFKDLKSLSFIESLNFILMSEDKLLEVATDKGLKTNFAPFCIKILNEQPKF